MINQCPNHKNYKGLKPSKRECSYCTLIYKQVQEKRKQNFTGFPSLSSPGETYSVEHILAELSCKMLYGNLPPYFWRKDAKVSNKIKEHYKAIYFGCKKWSEKQYNKPIYGNNPVDVFKKILFYIVTRYENEDISREEHSKQFIKSEVTEQIIKNNNESYFEIENKKKNKFESLKDIES